MKEQQKEEARKRILVALVVITVLVILSIIQCGCAKTLKGTGLIFEGFGDAVVAGGKHLQESSSNIEK